MALRPLHLLLALALLMIYFETTSSTEEDEFYVPEEDELETMDELVPRSPHRRRRRRHSAHSRHVRSRRKSRNWTRKPRIRIRRPGPGRDPCSPSPCRNAGVCQKVKKGWHKKTYTFKCKCKRPFYGSKCERGTARDPCSPSPCRNAGVCQKVKKGWWNKKDYTFKCKCQRPFYGSKCERGSDPCRNNPCLNGGSCERLGWTYTCKCRPGYRGSTCQDGSNTCYARGDPHYSTFDNKKIDFMGSCEYVLAEDCVGGHAKEFAVSVKNVDCGGFWFRRGASCTESVTVLLAGDKVELTRDTNAVLINNVKISDFPVIKSDYEITKPTSSEIYLTSNKVGLTVSWDCKMAVEVTLTDRHKGKTCGLCGNNNGNPSDDQLPDISEACKPLPERPCVPNSATKAEVDKCKLMKAPPFRECNAIVDPSDLIGDCEYDVCRCENPVECICSSFASYSKQCAENGKNINWRFQGSFLYPPLKACARKCENSGEIFKECALACERTCRDLSRDLQCSEECVPGCQCPTGQLLNDESRCIPIAECPCNYQGQILQAGDSVEVGKCETCTCNAGVMTCTDDRDCQEKGPCESFPCKNNGKCTEQGNLFSCECVGDYQGKTCEEPKPKPCDSSPCKHDGICSNKGASFTCQCRNNYIGRTCETKPPNPCSPNPCLNQGVCRVIGNGFSCKCPPLFGGSKCQDEQSSCTAAGDPHYTTFDNKKINFQGKCEYILAEDCSASKSFRVWTKNVACGRTGRGASCVSFVRILIGRVEIKLTRDLRTAIVNGAKVTQFPFKRTGFVITNPTERWLHVVTAIGVRVSWDCRNRVTVVVPGRYKGKTCGLCGNNNGNAADDTINVADYPCVPPDKNCVATADAAPIIENCDLMKNSPFTACNDAVDPTDFIEDCKFDACRCEDPMQCVCNSFAAYSQRCSRNAVVLDWRFSGTHLVPALSQCGQQCSIPSQVFTECGSSCVQSCRDLSRATECNEQCVPGCQCPQGLVLSDDNKCIPVAKCACEFEGKTLQPGESVEVGNCKTCTCDMGAVKCVEDRNCVSKGPCDSLPCLNDGICSVKGGTFSCQCSNDYQGSTCEELKPKPCDSQPCLNGGVCTNEGSSFSCKCSKGFKGDTCADAECVDKKLDILYVVDGSGSIREPNFESIKLELKEMNRKFDIGPDKIQIALMQFGSATDTKLEFKLGEKNSLQAVNEVVGNMKWLISFRTATGDALKKAREQVFNGQGGDRNTAANVLILFTDGKATDTKLVDQFEEAQKLKDAGVKVIAVAMGSKDFIDTYQPTLRKLASVDDETGQPLQFAAGFENLNDLTSKLVKEAC